MAVNTHTKVAAVSKIKMATAFLFLGGAALAASAAGGLAGKLPANAPDLVIKSIYLEPTQEPEGKGGGLTSGYDLYTITYENIGSVPVTKPFTIVVQSSPNPYMTWGGGDPVMYLAVNDAMDGDGYSGGFSELTMKSATKVTGSNLYTIPVNSPTGDSLNMYPGLNKYALVSFLSGTGADGYSGGFVGPNVGQVKVYISKFYQDMLGKGGKAKVGAYIDYLKTNRTGVILEKNENNNSINVNFDKSSYAVVPSNLCSADYIAPELAKDICKQQDGSFVCIDKYTKWYSACVKTAADCAKKIKTTVACEVDIASGQPYFDTVEVGIGGSGWESTKKFNLSYALGKYPVIDGVVKGDIDARTLYYPNEKMYENKLVRIKITPKNSSTSTVYGFYQDGGKNGTGGVYYDNGIFSPQDVFGNFSEIFKSGKVAWGSVLGYKFTTQSANSILYLGVKNTDATYFGFPNTKIADDAIMVRIMPAPLTPPAGGTPPTSTGGSGSSNPPTTTASNNQSKLSVVANAMQYMTIQQGSGQLVGDFIFNVVGDQTLCLKDARSQVIVSPENAVQFGPMVIHEYANPSPGYQFSSAFSTSYISNGILVFDFNSKFNNPPCIEGNSSKRLQFFLDDVKLSGQPYPATLLHKLMNVGFKNQVTGEDGVIYPVMTNGALEVK